MPTQQEISLNPTSVKGDILSFDGSSRIRIPVGTSANHILHSSSSATGGIEWKIPSGDAQAFTLISTATITASTATVSFENFSPSSYAHLKFVVAYVVPSSYYLPQVKFNSGSDIRYARMRSNIGDSGTSRVVNTPTTTTELRFSSWGISDSEVIGTCHLDIFMSNASSGRLPILFYWGPGGEQVTYPSGAYDFELTQGSGDVDLTPSTLSSVHFTMEGALSYASGTVIKLYGIKETQ